MIKEVKIKKASETKININQNQNIDFLNVFEKIIELETKLKEYSLEFDSNILTHTLLERESVDSSLIEGMETQHESIFFNFIEGIDNVYDWEIRNLINVQKSFFKGLLTKKLDYDFNSIITIHKELYKENTNDFIITFTPTQFIKLKKPGQIIIDDNKPNWIGTTQKKQLILIKPSKKIEYLKDLLNETKLNKSKKSLEILIMFHPLFEAIHPFSDGNGRIGRVLLTNLFYYLGFTKYNWIFISDIWNENKKEYINKLNEVETTDIWDNWIDFFIKSTKKTVEKLSEKINKILNLYLDIIKNNKLNELDKIILDIFFKYPISNQKKTTKYFKKKYSFSSMKIFRSFKKIKEIINCNTQNNNLYFEKLLNIIK